MLFSGLMIVQIIKKKIMNLNIYEDWKNYLRENSLFPITLSFTFSLFWKSCAVHKLQASFDNSGFSGVVTLKSPGGIFAV